MKHFKLLLALLALLSGVGNLSAQTDVTSQYITNAGFDTESDFQTTNFAAGEPNSVTGWTAKRNSTDYTWGGAIQFGGTGQINGANIPNTNSDGVATGGALCLTGGWNNNNGYIAYEQEITLPAGTYQFEIPVNNVGKNEQYRNDNAAQKANLFNFTTQDATYTGTVTTYPVNTWTTNKISFSLAEETTGTISIGFRWNHTGSGNTAKLVIDYVKALYTNYTETLKSTIDRATILNARANDSELATAITTAQTILNEADNSVAYQNTIDNAVTTLRSSISTAAAKVVLLEGENITFMLENADFESSTPVTGGITTYDYDAANNGTSFSRMQVVEGWTIGENGNAKSAGVYKFGENPFLGSAGTQYQAPATASSEGEKNALGIVAVWSSTAQYKQAVTFPEGSYIIEVPVYNTAGTTAFTKNLIGFVEDGGTEHLATAKTYATSSWITEKIIFELENETSGYMSLGYQAANAGSAAMPHLFIDNVKITYTSPIAAAKQRYDEALAAAKSAIENGDYANVTGNEKTALQEEIAKAEPTTKEGYNTAADALNEKTTAFTEAKENYDAYAAVKDTTVPELVYANPAKKTTLEEAIASEVTTAENAKTTATAITNALRAFYESHAMAEGVEGAKDYTDAVKNANADTNTGWTNGIGTNQGQGYTDAEGKVAPKYLDGGWASNAGANIDMTREVEIPAGKYLLTVTARGAIGLDEYTLSIGGVTANLPRNGGSGGVFGNGWDDVSLEFDADGTVQTLEVIAKSTASQQWMSINRFRLVQLEANDDVYAGQTEYEALNSAIAVAETKTLGFNKDEYAPYNIVAALQALAAAKAIDQTAEQTNLKTVVEAATTTLNNATWTSNDEDVDAIYNGSFAKVQEGANYPEGWTRTNGWGQMQNSITGDFATAYYNQPGSLQYGNQGVYTMPLAAETFYKLTFSYRSHENNSNNGMKVSVLNGEEGLVEVSCEANKSATEWKTVTKYFTTGAAGNYILTLANDGNTWITGVSLVKDVAATADDYAALNDAITSAESYVLGFDENEFAPYMNVFVLKALAAAKAINQEEMNPKADVQTATNNLRVSWIGNAVEVNAVYDGTLKKAPIQATSENVVLPGWVTKSGNIRQTFKGTGEDGKAALADAIDQVGVFVHPGKYTYGETMGYTMPLKGGVVYRAEAKYCAWADASNNNFTLTILKDGETIATKSYGANPTACTEDGALKQVYLYFTPEENGDYVLDVVTDGNTFMTDFIIKRAVVTDLDLKSTDTQAPEEQFAGTINTDRTLLDGLNTIVLPFNTTKDEIGATTVLEYTGTTTVDETVTMNFKETENLKANVPYAVMLDVAATKTLSFENKEVTPSDNLTVTDTNGQFNFVGTYTDLVKGNETVVAGDYVAGATAFKKAAGGNRIAAYRAYLQKVGTSNVANVKFNFGGDVVDGIEALELLNKFSADGIFNLQGQKVNNAQKGVYIVNGKKIVVK